MKRLIRGSQTAATLAVAGLAVVLSACGGQKPPPKPTTQRQRDSAIGASGLPGARGIQKALQAQDSARAQNARLDSIQ
jgi:hypothetical protein